MYTLLKLESLQRLMKFMNAKQIKKINKLSDRLLIKWLKTIVPEEAADDITEENFKVMLPEAPYFVAKKSRHVTFYTRRWAKQKIKKLYKAGVSLESIEDISWLQK